MTTLYRTDDFTRQRIHARASELGMQLSDQEQWEFLQRIDTLDLQAAPGSGKTSLVGLKLLILAEHWASTTRGVCVLSHTNTAKDEIVAQVSDSPYGARLQRYPHFIGTIQSFTSTFLALPHLRGMRRQIQIVDNDAYADQAKRTLASDQRFSTLKAQLGRLHNGDDLVADAEFSFESGQLTIRSSRKLPFGLETKSGEQFTKLKNHLARQGIFRYADMFALAELHLFRRPTLGRAVAHRFPFVLIDEMQDTSAQQQKLLDQVFGDPSTVVQRVGDVNQQIFAEGTTIPSSFPRSDSLELPVSRRFGSTIAELASSLTVHRSQHIRGVGPAGTIAVLLYDETSVTHVIPAFERIAAEVIPHPLLQECPPRVLASRLRPGTSKAFPQSLACYAPGFAANIPGDQRASLLITARVARAQWRSGASRTAVDLLWEAVRAATKSATNEALPTLRSLSRETKTPGARIRALLLDILTDPNDDEISWDGLMNRLTGLLAELSKAGPVRLTLGEVAHYVAPSVSSSMAVVGERGDAAVETVRSDLGSIHSAKGETHTATLILECLNRSGKNHDVHEVLRLLATNGDLESATSTVREIAQLVFVGATRPTQLLAFAVHRDRGSPYLDFFASNDWLVHDLALQSDSAGAGTVKNDWRD
ncbi:AAA family ATPase [Nocardia sp. SYP-A9097]|uniref:UvrD-helicase domain-containing protein n=1 Tax=Nocardia sp. SYP-A9097 TaxID=2663237 RepID=UPI00129C0697|nr:UvrD-helicase domain-containing protein [Nocardia sp. SYP-A9097]MRH93561.1 AAA family ATPase [Nocardia sp. SYP-A9097]